MWRDRHFQDFGDGKELQGAQHKSSDEQQPVAIPGIDDVVASTAKKQLPYHPSTSRGYQLQMASGVRGYDFQQQKRPRFDLSLTGETGSYGGAMRSMESETGRSVFDESVMGSNLTSHGSGRAVNASQFQASRWTSSIRIPRTSPSARPPNRYDPTNRMS